MRQTPILLVAVCAAVVCVIALFAGLDRIGLVDMREARDAQVAREIALEQELLAPLFAYEPHFEKPLLAYAPELAARLISRTLDGRPDLTRSAARRMFPHGVDVRSRQVRAVLGVLLVVLVTAIGGSHFGRRTGWTAGLVLASTVALPIASRTDGAQMVGTLLGWLGIAGLADGLFGPEARRSWRLLFGYGALAAALVCAGPLPALWPLGGLFLYLALARDVEAWRRAQPVAGLALILGLGLPWYGAMIERYGAAFWSHAPFFPYATDKRLPWFTWPMTTLSYFVLACFPWSTLLPVAIQRAGTKRPLPHRSPPDPMSTAMPLAKSVDQELREDRVAYFLIACLIAALVPMLIYPRPPISAALPAMPAAALLCARFLGRVLEKDQVLATALTRALVLNAAFGTVLAWVVSMVARRTGEFAPDFRILATFLFATSWIPALAGFAGRRRLAALLLALPVAAGTPLVTLRLLPRVEEYLNARPIAEAMNVAAPRWAALIAADRPPPSLRFYLERNLVAGDSLAAQMRAHRSTDGYSYVACRPARESEVARAASAPLEVLLRTRAWVLVRAAVEP